MSKKPTIQLNKEEKALERAIAAGEYVSVKNVEAEKAKYQKAATDTFAKMKTVNLRISERNLLRLRAAAAKEGVSYQTLITSLIQKHVAS